MDIHRLVFDARAILQAARRWVEVESPSWDAVAVSRMAELAGAELQALGAQVRRIAGRNGYGDCVLGDFAPGDPAPGILILGHLDTVHAAGSLAGPVPWREEAGRCYGPGLFDMKSGNVMALEALRQIRAAGWRTRLPVRVLFTSDEESGSPSTRTLIEEIAKQQRYVLVPEGAQHGGRIVSGRFPSCRLRLWTRGRPSHALLQREQGRSAILAMAQVIQRIEALNDGDVSCTVTYLEAGRTVATVPVESYAELVCTTRSTDGLERAIEAVRDIMRDDPGTELEVQIKTQRPLWLPSPADIALRQHAEGLGRSIGLELRSEAAFGGSDGNFTGALGIPTLDELGAVGADAHQLTESIELASLVPRTRLMAGLLATLA
ncbi:M20/M25/M40 family metallo-hydrolase [Roseomonas elaeocarpi]|uniref:M20/M25/M40 family metallo-hydrolase n=1 Tax=Roseomonas elaeocarpi TaxID=907779 RepID=A0ABV6JPT5_9PROT